MLPLESKETQASDWQKLVLVFDVRKDDVSAVRRQLTRFATKLNDGPSSARWSESFPGQYMDDNFASVASALIRRKLEKELRVLGRLHDRRSIRPRDIAADFGVSIRTAQRWLAQISVLGLSAEIAEAGQRDACGNGASVEAKEATELPALADLPPTKKESSDPQTFTYCADECSRGLSTVATRRHGPRPAIEQIGRTCPRCAARLQRDQNFIWCGRCGYDPASDRPTNLRRWAEVKASEFVEESGRHRPVPLEGDH